MLQSKTARRKPKTENVQRSNRAPLISNFKLDHVGSFIAISDIDFVETDWNALVVGLVMLEEDAIKIAQRKLKNFPTSNVF